MHEDSQKDLSEELLKICADQHPIGSVGLGGVILDWMWEIPPTETLRAAYFENLELLLKKRPKRQVPGQIVFGLGTGRCGSTSLTALLGTIAESRSTHENPPPI